MTAPLRKIYEKSYSGVGTFREFLDKTIMYVFQKKELDVESHVMPTVNENILRRKEHQRGIHRRPKVDINPDNDDDLLSESS